MTKRRKNQKTDTGAALSIFFLASMATLCFIFVLILS